ncbi:MAG: hypothetical protein WAO98_07085 [Alphaproteobacteria bacterium]
MIIDRNTPPKTNAGAVVREVAARNRPRYLAIKTAADNALREDRALLETITDPRLRALAENAIHCPNTRPSRRQLLGYSSGRQVPRPQPPGTA